MTTIAEEIGKRQYPGQVLVSCVTFYDERNAERLARWLNRHLGAGRASKCGKTVVVGAIPQAVMAYAYSRIGALPAYEEYR